MDGEETQQPERGGDPSLRGIASDLFGAAIAAGPEVAAGAEIGPYTLEERIGAGGFGEVWRARQEEPVRREVALKVVKLGMDTAEFVVRFEAERQALVRMEHPGIARVIDAGSTRGGRPYMVMELVGGIPVNQFCDEHGLDTRARLELVESVCRAIQHAHQKGVIHRDIKPSNILVALDDDGKPAAKVIDFGLAKAVERPLTEASLHTMAGQFMGTPAYVSPEQAAGAVGDVDTRADIYSLGVLMYELLVGAPPFDAEELMAGGLEAMGRIIRDREPARPSSHVGGGGGGGGGGTARTTIGSLPRQRRSELDWIVMRALEKEPERRYQSASALAEDIGRFLRGDAVEAAAPSRLYRLRKFTRRHRLPLAAAAVVALTLVGGIIGTSWQAQVAKANARAEREAREEAEIVSKFLAEVFASPDPELDGRHVTVAEMLAKGADRARRDFANRPRLLAKILRPVAKSFISLGLPEEALPILEELDALAATVDSSEAFRLEVLTDIATCYQLAGRDEAALKLRRRVYGAVAARPEDDTFRLLALNNLGASLIDMGLLAEAETIQSEQMRVFEKMYGAAHPETLTALGNLAVTREALGQTEVVLEDRRRILAGLRRTLRPDHPDILRAQHDLAMSLADNGEFGEAIALGREAAEGREHVLGPLHLDTCDAWGNLAITLKDRGETEAALEIWGQVVAKHAEAGRELHPSALSAVNHRAVCRAELGDLETAIADWTALVEDYDRIFEPDHADTESVLFNLAKAYLQVPDLGKSIQMQEEIARRKLGD